MSSVILGCGDVGLRIAQQLLKSKSLRGDVVGFVNSLASVQRCSAAGVTAWQFDLDKLETDLSICDGADIYYTVAPQKSGVADQRSASLISWLNQNRVHPKKAVVISTTGVYGDHAGEWVTEETPVKPQTERGQRRLDLERQWLGWGQRNGLDVVILRVPGIYAFSRLPRERIAQGTPVVKASECGFTNRIHADDLAAVSIAAMQRGRGGDVFNVTDGVPGKISEYLQAAAQVLNLPALPEISMLEAQQQLSAGMLSYLGESRKISNEKMLEELQVELRFVDFREGLKY